MTLKHAIIVLALITLIMWAFAASSAVVGEAQYQGRTYHYALPDNPSGPLAIILCLHGYSGDGNQCITHSLNGRYMTANADTHDYIVIAPDGTVNQFGKQSWHACESDNVDDILYLEQLLSHAVTTYGGDPDAIYVFGWSNGGQMTDAMARYNPGLFQGATAVLFQELREHECAQALGPIPMQYVVSTHDWFICFAGCTEYLSANETIAYWQGVNGIVQLGAWELLPDMDPVDGMGCTGNSRVYRRTDIGTYPVEFVVVADAGHTLPGEPPSPDRRCWQPTNQDVLLVDLMFDFWGF